MSGLFVTNIVAGAVPVNIVLPAISGTAQVGQTLTTSNGTWTNSPTSFAYQWQREGSNIGGATSSTYTLALADLASLVTVRVIARNGTGASLPARSAIAGPSAGLIKIMPLGDSITQGFNSLGGYREPLWYLLQNDKYNIAYVGSWSSNGRADFPFANHEGHGGFTISGAGVGGTTNLQYGIDTLNWLNVNPDVILLLVGINDFFASRSNAQANADYSALIDDILGKLPNVKVICGSLVQQGSSWVDTFNSNLVTLVGTKGPRVSFVDLHAALTSSDLLGDNTHPNQGGYNKMAPVWKTGVEAILPAAASTVGPVIGTTVRYVSQSAGNDTWDGTAPAFVSGTTGPWQTLAKVNGASLSPGTSVLFKRGDTWRDGSGGTASGLKTAQLRPKSGTNGNPIVYDAYSTGPNPRYLGSVAASNTTDWTNTSGNIWTSNSVFQPTGANGNGQPVENANDVGLVTWGTYPNRSVGSMVDLPGQSDASLTTQGKWLFNTTDWKVHIFSVGNPATAMPGLELSIDADMIWGYGLSDVIVQNLTLFNGAGHGIPYGGASNRITIRDCIIGWIGGGNLGGGGTRYGNGTQISGGGSFCLVERNWIFECFDGGITQESFSATNTTFDNLTYRNNVVYNCPTLIELNLGNNAGNVMSNIFCYNNTCPNPAGNTNRPPGNGNSHVLLNPSGVVPTVAFNVENNSLTFGAIGLNISNYTWGQGLVVFDYNNWNMANNVHSNSPALDTLTIAQWAAGYTPAQETHGLLQTAPQYVDSTLGDVDPNNLAPAAGSPLFNAGTNLFGVGVVWDFNKKPRPSSGPFTIGAFQ
jgi:lysophospholipase L1-like esterase